MRHGVIATITALLIATPTRASVDGDIALVRGVSGTEGASAEAQAAWSRLAAGGPEVLPKLLSAMAGADTVAQNWLRACFDAAAERTLETGGFPRLQLNTFLGEQDNAPRARRTAFDWVTRIDPSKKAPLLDGMLQDQSLSLRYEAIDQLMAKAETIDDQAKRKSLYSQALTSARDLGQLEKIAGELEKFGVAVDLPQVMGFLKQWRVIGPFDNTGLAHFDTAYPPESELDFDSEYDGKLGKVGWQEVTATGDGGEVDFIAPLGKEKEAVAYAYTTFKTRAGEAEVRYQSKNATKVWVNGKLVTTNEVYHSGGGIDQYRATCSFVEGENSVLIKVCQNKQLMPWEREWDFRLRIVDSVGTPVAAQ